MHQSQLRFRRSREVTSSFTFGSGLKYFHQQSGPFDKMFEVVEDQQDLPIVQVIDELVGRGLGARYGKLQWPRLSQRQESQENPPGQVGHKKRRSKKT